jgi:hypothetical protein
MRITQFVSSILFDVKKNKEPRLCLSFYLLFISPGQVRQVWRAIELTGPGSRAALPIPEQRKIADRSFPAAHREGLSEIRTACR